MKTSKYLFPAFILLSFCLPKTGCKTVNTIGSIQPESITLQLSPAPGKFAVRYTMVNRNDFTIAVMKSHVPSKKGELLDNIFKFELGTPSYIGTIAQYEWDAEASVVKIEPSGEYGMTVHLGDYYSGLEAVESVSVNHLMQVAKIKEGKALESDDFELVQVKSNNFTL